MGLDASEAYTPFHDRSRTLTWGDDSYDLPYDLDEVAVLVEMLVLFADGHKLVVLAYELLHELVHLGYRKAAHRVPLALHALARQSDLQEVRDLDGLVKVRLWADVTD